MNFLPNPVVYFLLPCYELGMMLKAGSSLTQMLPFQFTKNSSHAYYILPFSQNETSFCGATITYMNNSCHLQMACPCKGSPHSRTFKEVVVMIPFYRGGN